MYTGFSGANVFGVPIGTMIGDWVGWRFTFLFIMAVSVLVGILMIIYLPKESELAHANRSNHSSDHDSEIPSRILRPMEIKIFNYHFLSFSSKLSHFCVY